MASSASGGVPPHVLARNIQALATHRMVAKTKQTTVRQTGTQLGSAAIVDVVMKPGDAVRPCVQSCVRARLACVCLACVTLGCLLCVVLQCGLAAAGADGRKLLLLRGATLASS